MESLRQVLSASMAVYNLPLTILFVAVLGYWLLVCLGLFDIDFGLDGDLDPDGSGRLLSGALGFMGAGQVPVMFVMSLLVLFLWLIAVVSNYYLNPGQAWWLALVLLVPNFIASLVLTRLLIVPLKPLFAALHKDYDKAIPIVGQICSVTTGEVTESFGQATIETEGAPILINVRISSGDPLVRGDQALVVEEDREKQLYKVVKYEQPKLEI